MLPACRSGKTSTFALPATGLPGHLRSPTVETSAASACISPSTFSSGACSCTSFTALATLSTFSCLAEPFVEKESIATRGSRPSSALPVCAEAIAISASCSLVGSMFTAQSPNTSTPSSPYFLSCTSIRKQEETVLMPGAPLMICSAGRSTSPVVLIAPATIASASPILSIIVP